MFEKKNPAEQLTFPPQIRHVAPGEYKTILKEDGVRALSKAEVDWVLAHPKEAIGLYKLRDHTYFLFPYQYAYANRTAQEFLIIAIVSEDPEPHLISFSNPNAAILLENNTRVFLHDGSLGEFLPF